MKKYSEIKAVASELNTDLTKSLEGFAEVRKTDISKLDSATYEEAHVIVSSLISGIKAMIGGTFASNGSSFPEFLTNFKSYGRTDGKDGLKMIEVTVKSKLKDSVKFKTVKIIHTGKNFMTELTDCFSSAIFSMFYMHRANENLQDVNTFIKNLCEEKGIPFTFRFVLGGGKEYVSYIDNKEVVFCADLSQALDISKNGLFQSGDSYFDLVMQQETEKLVETLSAIQTTTQLVKSRINLISTLVGKTTKKRADRLIRLAYHKNATYFKDMKSGVGYFEFEKDGVSVFTILEKKEDGTIDVVLNPFDIKTLATVDVDAVAELNKVLA